MFTPVTMPTRHYMCVWTLSLLVWATVVTNALESTEQGVPKPPPTPSPECLNIDEVFFEGENSGYAASDNSDEGLNRRRRLIHKTPTKHWDKGIIPYGFEKTLWEVERLAIDRAMELYQKNTPIRFVPLNRTVFERYGIKPGAAYFRHRQEGGICGSLSGKSQKRAPQNIFCCTKDTCIHEMGHLLGMMHEHAGHDRHNWINVLQKNIVAGTELQYKVYDGNQFLDVPYDVYSIMQYQPQYKTGNVRYTYNFPELDGEYQTNMFYTYHELCIAYKCHEYSQCEGKTLSCVNDGFVTVYDDVCSCLCPDGLDPATGCAKPINKKCGGVIHLTNSNSAAIISYDMRNGDQNEEECHWIIRGDPDVKGNLFLDFDDFEVKKSEDAKCVDTVGVSFTRLAHPGYQQCGSMSDLTGSIRSVLKDMRVVFKTQVGSTSHFKATVTWKPDSELCYNSEDNGASYAGLINYSYWYEPCVSWDDVIGKCSIHPFKNGRVIHNLEGNYCRNPDDSFRPWCYTNVENCQKRYCDVCQDDTPFNAGKKFNCDDVDENMCNTNAVAAVDCAKKCRIKEKDAQAKCSRKDIPGTTLENPKTVYGLNEKAVYKCNNEPQHTMELTCRSDGEWSEGNTPCTLCPEGWSPFNGTCYIYIKTAMEFDDAEAHCPKLGATFASPLADNEHFLIKLSKLRNHDVGIWEDSYVMQNGKVMHFKDYAQLVFLLEAGDNAKLTFFCQKPISLNAECADFVDNCEYLMTRTETVTCDTTPELHNLCRKSCGFCTESTTNLECPRSSLPLLGQTILGDTPDRSGFDFDEKVSVGCSFNLTSGHQTFACTDCGEWSKISDGCT